MFSNGIIIEGNLAETLLHQAVAEGFCKSEPDRESRVKTSLATAPMRDRLSDVLGLMLLYGKVILPAQDYLSPLQRLGEMGLVQFEPYPKESIFDLSTRAGAQQLFDATNYQWGLLQRINPLTSDPLNDPFTFIRVDPLVTYALYHRGLGGDSGSKIFDEAVSELDEKYQDLPFSEFAPHDSKAAERVAMQIILAATYVSQLVGLQQMSARLEVPLVLSNIWQSNRHGHYEDRPDLGAAEPEMWRAYQIYLEGAEVAPRVHSLGDVLRLRADPRLRSWQETMHRWWLALQSGDQNAENNLRAEIGKANRDLRKLDHWRKIGGIVTYVSLPIAVASALTGFPGGLVMAPLGVGVRVYSELQQRRHRWLMLGR